MVFVRNVLRVYSWVFEAILCTLSVAVASLTLFSGNQLLIVGWLPWTGTQLTSWMIGLGITGLLCVLLAVLGSARVLLFLFSIFVAGLLIKGFFLNLSYSFDTPAAAKRALLLIGGALLAIAGAWPYETRRHRR